MALEFRKPCFNNWNWYFPSVWSVCLPGSTKEGWIVPALYRILEKGLCDLYWARKHQRVQCHSSPSPLPLGEQSKGQLLQHVETLGAPESLSPNTLLSYEHSPMASHGDLGNSLTKECSNFLSDHATKWKTNDQERILSSEWYTTKGQVLHV